MMICSRCRAPAVAAVILALALTACGDDGPSGPSADFDIVGAWQWRVNNATDGTVTCTVTNVTLTFERANGALTGTRFSPGGGNLTCTAPFGSTTGNFTTNSTIKQLVHTGTDVSFEFDTSAGNWVIAGSITSDNSMGGSATIRIASSVGGNLSLTGPWTATRN